MYRSYRESYADIVSPAAQVSGDTTANNTTNLNNTVIKSNYHIQHHHNLNNIAHKLNQVDTGSSVITANSLPVHNYHTQPRSLHRSQPSAIQQQTTKYATNEMLFNKPFMKQYVISALSGGVIVRALHTISDTTILHTYSKHRIVQYNISNNTLQYRSLNSRIIKGSIQLEHIIDCMTAPIYFKQYSIRYDTNSVNVNNSIILRCKKLVGSNVITHYVVECFSQHDYIDIYCYFSQLIQYSRTNQLNNITFNQKSNYTVLSILNCMVTGVSTTSAAPVKTPRSNTKSSKHSSQPTTELQRELYRVELLSNLLSKYQQDLIEEDKYNNQKYNELYHNYKQMKQLNLQLSAQMQLLRSSSTSPNELCRSPLNTSFSMTSVHAPRPSKRLIRTYIIHA